VGSVVWRASPGCELAEYTEPERKLWRGDPALVYRSGQLSVVVLPQRGGKIASIRYRDREWLTQPQRALLPLADLPPHVLLESSSLPGNLNRDPADRILAATAREYGYTVMTRDKALLDYGREGHLSVLEC